MSENPVANAGSSLAHRRSPRGDGLSGPLQLRLRQEPRRVLRPAHRGHRPRPVHRRLRSGHPRFAALAGDCLGRGAGLGGPPRPLPPERAAPPSTGSTWRGCWTRGRPIAASAPAERLEEMRRRQGAGTGYDRHCRDLPAAEVPVPRRGGGGARGADEGAARRRSASCTTSFAGRSGRTGPRWTTRSSSSPTGIPTYHLANGGGRPPDGDHPRDPRARSGSTPSPSTSSSTRTSAGSPRSTATSRSSGTTTPTGPSSPSGRTPPRSSTTGGRGFSRRRCSTFWAHGLDDARTGRRSSPWTT